MCVCVCVCVCMYVCMCVVCMYVSIIYLEKLLGPAIYTATTRRGTRQYLSHLPQVLWRRGVVLPPHGCWRLHKYAYCQHNSGYNGVIVCYCNVVKFTSPLARPPRCRSIPFQLTCYLTIEPWCSSNAAQTDHRAPLL